MASSPTETRFFDSFDGTHPKITVPREHGPHEFRSIEDVNNYLLRHKEVRARIGQWEAERPSYAEPLLEHADPEFERGRGEGRRQTLQQTVAAALA